MTKEIETAVDGDVLKVVFPRYSGVDDATSWLTAIAIECSERGLKKVLIDTTSSRKPVPVWELSRLGNNMASIKHNKTRRFAFVLRPEAMQPDRFFETVAANRGLTVREFIDPDEAMNWLQGIRNRDHPLKAKQ